MLSVVSLPLGFHGVAVRAPIVQPQMGVITPGDVGTTRPLGVFDPLNLIGDDPVKYRRWQEMEIKHGRIAMLAILHVIATGAGYKWDGYASYLSFPPVAFKDIPSGTVASWEALPTAGWAQIVALVAILDNSLFAQVTQLTRHVFVNTRPLLTTAFSRRTPTGSPGMSWATAFRGSATLTRRSRTTS